MAIGLITAWIAGICIGFAWGCGKALRSPAWARGFIYGFTLPWRWLARRAQKEGE